MNKVDIVNTIKKYNLDTNKYIILSGAAMVLLGLKETTNDIDLAVTKDMYDYLVDNYECEIEKEIDGIKIYIIDNKLNFSTRYYDSVDILYVNNIPVQNELSIKKLKQGLNRDKDLLDIKRIEYYMSMSNFNSLTLAYLGDSIYETYIRKFLIDSNIVKVKELQECAIKYVSAKAQSKYLKELINSNCLTVTELEIQKCARNHKCNHKPKNCDIITYKCATGFEAIIGFLYLKNNITRIEEIINYIIRR